MNKYIVSTIAALLVLTGCSGCGGRYSANGPTGLDELGLRRALQSSVRIRVLCNGELVGYGSGVAVSDHHVITARHVARGCEDTETPDMAEFEILTPDGTKRLATNDGEASDENIDVARLVLTDSTFTVWAPISGGRPDVADDIYIYAGDGTMDMTGVWFFFTRGSVSKVGDKTIVLQIHGVPGNSGCAIFNRAGEVVAILHSGSWNSAIVFRIFADRPDAWRDLFPPFVMELD